MDDKLVDLTVFGASWCHNCKTVKQLLDDEGTAFAYIDVDSPAGKAMAQDFNVRGLPQAFYKGDRAFASVAQCKDWLRRNGSDKHPRPEMRGYEPRPAGLADLLGVGRDGIEEDQVARIQEMIRARNADRVAELRRNQMEMDAFLDDLVPNEVQVVHDVPGNFAR